MKKKLVGALAGFVATALIAGPVNNPASSAQFESGLFTGAQQDYTFRVGYVGDCVKDRRVKDKTTNAHLDQLSLSHSGMSLTLGLFDRFDIFAVTGAASSESLNRHAGSDVSVAVRDGSFWTFGARATLWTLDNTTINAFADYGRSHGDVTSVKYGALNSGYTNTTLKGKSWQLGLGFAQTIQVSPDMSVVPALTVRYSDASYRYNNHTVSIADENSIYNANQVATSVALNDMKARAKLGLGIGCGIYAGKMFGLNIEGRFMDETAAAITAEIRI